MFDTRQLRTGNKKVNINYCELLQGLFMTQRQPFFQHTKHVEAGSKNGKSQSDWIAVSQKHDVIPFTNLLDDKVRSGLQKSVLLQNLQSIGPDWQNVWLSRSFCTQVNNTSNPCVACMSSSSVWLCSVPLPAAFDVDLAAIASTHSSTKILGLVPCTVRIPANKGFAAGSLNPSPFPRLSWGTNTHSHALNLLIVLLISQCLTQNATSCWLGCILHGVHG